MEDEGPGLERSPEIERRETGGNREEEIVGKPIVGFSIVSSFIIRQKIEGETREFRIHEFVYFIVYFFFNGAHRAAIEDLKRVFSMGSSLFFHIFAYPEEGTDLYGDEFTNFFTFTSR